MLTWWWIKGSEFNTHPVVTRRSPSQPHWPCWMWYWYTCLWFSIYTYYIGTWKNNKVADIHPGRILTRCLAYRPGVGIGSGVVRLCVFCDKAPWFIYGLRVMASNVFYPMHFQAEGVLSLPCVCPVGLSVRKIFNSPQIWSGITLVTDLSWNHQICT